MQNPISSEPAKPRSFMLSALVLGALVFLESQFYPLLAEKYSEARRRLIDRDDSTQTVDLEDAGFEGGREDRRSRARSKQPCC